MRFRKYSIIILKIQNVIGSVIVNVAKDKFLEVL